MKIKRSQLRKLIRESLATTYEQHFGIPPEMDMDVWMNWITAYGGTIEDLDSIARQLGAPDHSWLPETPDNLGDDMLYRALKRALSEKMALALDDEPYITEPNYSHEDLPPMAEVYEIDLSGFKPTIRQLLKMDIDQAWSLVNALDDQRPGLKHSYVEALKDEYRKLEDAWNWLPPAGGSIDDRFPPEESILPGETLDNFGKIENIIGQYMADETINESRSKTIKESVTADEMSKIERMWWNQMPGDPLDPGYNHDFPDRDYAIKFIKVLNIDPKDLKIWNIISPEGLIEPYDSNDNPVRLSLRDIERALDEYNNHPSRPFKVSIHSINYTETPSEADAYVLIESKGLVGSRHAWTRAVWMIDSIMENL